MLSSWQALDLIKLAFCEVKGPAAEALAIKSGRGPEDSESRGPEGVCIAPGSGAVPRSKNRSTNLRTSQILIDRGWQLCRRPQNLRSRGGPPNHQKIIKILTWNFIDFFMDFGAHLGSKLEPKSSKNQKTVGGKIDFWKTHENYTISARKSKLPKPKNVAKT